jgi:hypothetical protein
MKSTVEASPWRPYTDAAQMNDVACRAGSVSLGRSSDAADMTRRQSLSSIGT